MVNIKDIFKIAVDKKASDVHLVVGLKPKLRIDGVLTSLKDVEELVDKDLEEMIFSMITEEQKKIFLDKHDLDFSFSLDNKDRFRVNIHYEKSNFGLVARVIKEQLPTLDEINIPPIISNLLNMTQGLILVTGPTGCGKSTTLAAMINYINNNRNCHIVTLEDPIEFLFKPNKSIVIQRQLGSDMPTFSSGLKHILRQDPDVIMVGEMRDLETISATITLAETGHLVLATLHTYSAAQTIDRIIDIFPPHQQNQIRMQLSMTLAAVVSQRLLSRADGGRIAAREIMLNTPAIANLIRENKIAQIKTVLETNAKEGMISLDQDLKRLYKEKKISKDVAQSQMVNPEMLEKFRFL